MKKKIASIEIVSPGSNPDVDTDFHTQIVDDTVDHLRNLYGTQSVANISTISTLKGKSAFKQICTIYEVPFSVAQKLSDMIPDAIEGDTATLADLFDKESSFYGAGSDFRAAVSDKKWDKVIKGALALEGRTKTLGTHACGIIVSSKELSKTVPMMMDTKKDGSNIRFTKTQWPYPQLEDMGLIKLDLLGLDTVDIIHLTLENIIKNGKEPPNMIEKFGGDRDDRKTYELLSSGFTEGVFQLSSPGMQELLRRMSPRSFEDIVAVSALYRPGPMGTNSHTEYAERRAGRSQVEPLHPGFAGTRLEEILEDTQGIMVYQEQVMQIANEIAGMSLQEGDDLRKAMGKKQMSVMSKMRPRFIKGGVENNYPQDAMEHLWEAMVPFASYAFNKAHSVAYGLNTYATAYLKANYPVEFMSALIAQNIKDRDKVREHIKEANRMGITMGPIDINASDVQVSPDYNNITDFDIVFGLGGIKAVTEENAKTIVKERDKNGPYSTVQDVIKRMETYGLTNRRIFENLAKAGAFDSLGIPRKQIVEKIKSLIQDAQKTSTMGASLFDFFEEEDSVSISLDGEEYSFPEKMSHEADIIGMYVSDHPLAHLGTLSEKYRTTTIKELLSKNTRSYGTIIGVMIAKTERRNRRGGKTVRVTIDDGTGYIDAILSRPLVKGIDKKETQKRLKKSYETGEVNITPEAETLISDHSVIPLENISLNYAYIINIAYRPSYDNAPPFVSVVNMKPIEISHEGKLPLRLRVNSKGGDRAEKIYQKLPSVLSKKFPGDTPILIANRNSALPPNTNDNDFIAAAQEMKRDRKNNVKVDERRWPPSHKLTPIDSLSDSDKEFSKALSLDLEYKDSGYSFSPNQESEGYIEKLIGIENYDYGTATEESVKGVE